MKYYSLLARNREQWQQLNYALEYLKKDYEWIGIFELPRGTYHAVRALLSEDQLVILKLMVDNFEATEVFI